MNARMKLAAPLVLATLGAIAATGFTSRMSETTAAPASDVAPAAMDASASPVAVDDSAQPIASDEPVTPAAMPATRHYSQPRVTVTAPRPSDDELLRNVVMDRLSSDSRISGLIGVEAYRHTVSLTGRVGSPMQIERAGMIARSVDGVWDVNNLLRARVGES